MQTDRKAPLVSIRTVLDVPATFRLRPDLHWSLVEEIILPTTLGDLSGADLVANRE